MFVGRTESLGPARLRFQPLTNGVWTEEASRKNLAAVRIPVGQVPKRIGTAVLQAY